MTASDAANDRRERLNQHRFMWSRLGNTGPRCGALLCAILAPIAAAQEPQPKHAQHAGRHSPEEINKQFLRPDLDVSEYIKRFESENRDIAAAKREILNAVAAKPGDRIADIGAGTGMFTREFARVVGPDGRVYPVEISPSFLSHIISEAEKGGYASVLTPVLGTFDSSMLPPDSVDIVFLCSTYHHFGHPERNLASIHRALKPGGRVVLIDFDRERAKAPFAREHARAPKEVYFAEFEKAGLTRLATKTGPKMADNFYAEFTKPAK